MNLPYFTRDEKIAYLEKQGYEIYEEYIDCRQSVYHNDVEFWKVSRPVVWKDGRRVSAYQMTGYGEPAANQFVDDFFNKLMEEKLKTFLLELEV